MIIFDDHVGEKCAVFGVYGAGFEAARIVLPGLLALQHRGQESSGIAATDGKTIKCHKDRGLVLHVYDEEIIARLTGHAAIGHNRYSTHGGARHIQPVMREGLALAHNGNLPSTRKLEEFLQSVGIDTSESNDSEMMADAIHYFLQKGATLASAIAEAYPLFTGVFSMLVMTKDELAAVRDPYGIRPLSLGKLNGGYVFASETCALDTIGATYLEDVPPGQMMMVNKDGLQKAQVLAEGEQRLDIFEFVYFSRPDSILLGKRVNEVRRNFGKILAKEWKVKADVVIPVPDTAIPVAEGFSEVTGIPLRQGLVKNRYIQRTFITPEQHIRKRHVAMKLIPIPEVLAGKKVVVLDDSIVRSTTSGLINQILRQAGAKEIFMGISSPPVRCPDFYGIDIPKQNELVAAQMSVEEIQKEIGVDELRYLSYKGMIEATGMPEEIFSTSCFTGEYPLDIGERRKEVFKFV